jgi:hypothetical protein
MKLSATRSRISRRRALVASATLAGGHWISGVGAAQSAIVKEGTVRDRFWLFACPVNSDFPNIHRRSVMSPVEGAYYLGIPNIIMVNTGGDEAKYGRFEPPFDQYAVSLRPLKRAVWGIVGSGGVTTEQEQNLGLELARRASNFVGVFMDDLFTSNMEELYRSLSLDFPLPQALREGRVANLTYNALRQVRRQLKGPGKKLDLFVTLYTHQLDQPLGDYLSLIDVVTLWTWKPADLVNLESNLQKLEKLAPRARKMLGCFLVDYTEKKSTPLPAMELQCERGLRWLRQGRIEGIIFLGNTVMDLGFEAVDWTREWIEKVGDTQI